MNPSAIYIGSVVHQRLRPVRHRLRSAIFYLLIDLDELPRLHARLKLFSFDRFNLFAFHQRDHGDGTPGGLRAWVERLLGEADLPGGGPVQVMCMPRLLGHAFNPITVFFCHGPDANLVAMIYEVRNTFGEKHCYLLAVEGAGGTIRQQCRKQFFVSPFMAMDMLYRFRVTRPDETISLSVTVADASGPMLATAFAGSRSVLTDRALLGRFVRMPLLGTKVLFAIHWEAALLWLKGLPLLRRPPPPAHPVSLN
jgi:DUF1365 family protein